MTRDRSVLDFAASLASSTSLNLASSHTLQILGWINVIEAHKKLGLELPVNLKMCFEGMEESGSEGLDELIEAEKDKFFKGTDAVCISDNYWLNTTTPCLTYGLRGKSLSARLSVLTSR